MMKIGMKKDYLIISIIFIFSLVLISPIITAPPPAPHTVKGIIFDAAGSGVENGIPVFINDTDNGNSVLIQVYAPPVPALKGSYSAAINGSDNDIIIVRAWNSTTYGENTSTLATTTTTVNVIINITRPSETNITLLYLQNNNIYNVSGISQISAQINILGQSATNCYAVLDISNTSVINVSGDTYPHYLGALALGSSTFTDWDVVGLDEGIANISVHSYCDSDGINLDQENYDYIYNLTLEDSTEPIVSLIYPSNNSNMSYVHNPISFIYNVTDESEIINCSLILNGKINLTNYTIEKNLTQYFYQTLAVGNYIWGVECIDNSTSEINGSSPAYNLSIVPNSNPVISNIIVEDPIDLTIGGTKMVYCNFTLYDEDNKSDIKSVNSTLYHSSAEADSLDDNNNHYTNNSCTIVSSSKFEVNYSCSYPLQYYSNQGTWTCNITVSDNSDAYASSESNTYVNELIAIEITEPIIDFGDLEAGEISSDDVNLTLTNLGNKDINISLKGFALNEGDGFAMECYNGNIPVSNERYSLNYGEYYSDMLNLTSTLELITNFTLPQRTDDSGYGDDRNKTYWKIRIPYGVNGNCNGSVFFMAVPS